MKPLRDSIHQHKAPILDKYSFNRIFLNIEDILYLNRDFLDSLHCYQSGQSTESFGQICARHIDTFDPYKTYFLSKEDSLKAHQQKTKSNRAYSNFIINTKLEENRRINDLLILPIQRMPRYNLLFADILNTLDPEDQDAFYLKLASEKARNINQMQYGSDSPLLPLYTLIKSAPATFVGKRQLLGHFDATELLISSGKVTRPVTILVFSDKIVVVKRKSYSIQGSLYCENIEEKAKKNSDQPFEFKGWADIGCVELFHGLRDRPETFFLRTNLPDQDPNAPENDADNYFRKSDRLYSLSPHKENQLPLENLIKKKQALIELCQKQLASANLTENVELYHEVTFNIPAYARIYDENSYKQALYKNNILIVYVENEKVDLNSLLTNDVWIVILVKRENSGYRQKIYSRISLTPIRDHRETETEFIINDDIRSDGSLDFIKTLWNNCFFYERKLRATEAYSCIHDGLLRERARTRSRSRSLTRVASNMSVGRLFGARSRSTSPSRSSISTFERQQQDLVIDQSVPDPILKVAAVNDLFRNHQYSTPPATPVSPSDYAAALDGSCATRASYHRKLSHSDLYNDAESPFAHNGSIKHSSYQAEEYYHRPLSYHAHSNSFDAILSQTSSSSPEPISRPSTGTSHFSSHSSSSYFNPTANSDPISAYLSSNTDMYNSISSNNSSVLSYVEDKINESMRRREQDVYDDHTGYPERGNSYGRRGEIPSSFYPQQQQQQQTHESPVGIDKIYQLKNELNHVLDDMILQQQRRHNQTNCHNNAFESVRGLRSHIVSKIDEIINNTEHQNQQYLSFR
ncbi:hypothetical protein G6F43_007856 [Rhizopus delemar]|nr:hypothetical protein G6F43_007856 [Rhizopus delemar]